MGSYTLWLIEQKRSLSLRHLLWGVPITIGFNLGLFFSLANIIREVQPAVVEDIPMEIVVLEAELPRPEPVEPPPEPVPVKSTLQPPVTSSYTPAPLPIPPTKPTYTPTPVAVQPPTSVAIDRPVSPPREVKPSVEKRTMPASVTAPVMTTTTETAEEAPSVPFFPPVSPSNPIQEEEAPAAVAKLPSVETTPTPVLPKVEKVETVALPPLQTAPEKPQPPMPEAVLPKEIKPYVPEEEKLQEEGKVSCISCEKPSFPASARERGLQGQVRVSIDVAPSGIVEDVRLLTSSGHPELDEAAIEQVRRWRFTTSTNGRKGMSARINFELTDGDRRVGGR